MTDHRRLSLLPLAALLAAPGCGTEDVDTAHVVYAGAQAGPDQARLLVALAPTAKSYDDAEERFSTDPNPTEYHILMDGNRISYAAGDSSGLWVTEGSQVGAAYLPAGPHHFSVLAPGAAPIFEGDGQLPGGGTAVLLLFGSLDALQDRFLALPDAAASGNEHITVVNLMRDGRAIEVVSCGTVGAACAPLSPALALGDVYDAELPASISDACPPPSPAGVPCPSTLSPAGAGVGYRLVPSASVPAPPVQGLTGGIWSGISYDETPTVFLAAPVYLTDQGQPETVIH